MSGIATAIVGSTVVTGYFANKSAKAQEAAGNAAAAAQTEASDKSIVEIKRQFDAVQQLMKPYVDKGYASLDQQADLMGLNGPEKQQAAINGIASGPQMASLIKEGEAGILNNGAATGGLRGGNVQSALATLRPSMLSGLITDRLNQLGDITHLGQAAAAGQASAGMSTGSAIAQQFGNIGAANAGAALAGGRAEAGFYGGLGQSIGTLSMLKLLKGF